MWKAQASIDGNGSLGRIGSVGSGFRGPETGLVDLNFWSSPVLLNSGNFVMGADRSEVGVMDATLGEEPGLNRGLEQEVSDTIGVGNLIGVNMVNYKDEVRNIMLEEGINGVNQ
ncbi:hypothetical protein L1987_32627 [Smallanthus sonchifolius]|uniref:Uncharacterized protein n=1 Tax=Smallanthus sonchifolius TaxID=185202 RepID=A0ACB9HQ06_9ASTR|nr:hypothetical protein L1987_32627 [Smallanthus sonchifolius]